LDERDRLHGSADVETAEPHYGAGDGLAKGAIAFVADEPARLHGSLRRGVVEPGPVELSAGSSSSDIRSTADVIITGSTPAIGSEDRAFLSTVTLSVVAEDGGPWYRPRCEHRSG
jgi:hypothetical protein